MTLIELIFALVGACVVLVCGTRLAHMLMMLSPRVWYPLPENFFTSMGKWAVITGGSDGIGKAYAQKLANCGLNVVIISRNKEKLDRVARDIELETKAKVIAISVDFTKDDVYGGIKENIQGLDVAILVNNVGILPTQIPCRLLETEHLEERANASIDHPISDLRRRERPSSLLAAYSSEVLKEHRDFEVMEMCHIILPGMVERGRGIILTVSSGIAKIPCPTYAIYAATKVFVERFSQGLQAEYKSSGILFQTVSPFGVSTQMTGYQRPDFFTFTAEEFVRNSLKYLKAGEQTYGSISHAALGWVVQAIPTWILRSEAFQHHLQEFVKKKVGS